MGHPEWDPEVSVRERIMKRQEPQDDKPFDIAIVGELNLDLILYGLPLVMEAERDLLGTGFTSTLGSSSGIVAHNAATLGMRVRFATMVGDDDFGRIALGRLQQAGVDTSCTIVDANTATGVTILLPHGDERHSLTYLGTIASLTVDHLDRQRLAQARHFHISSLFLQTGLHAGIVDLVRFLKSSGLTVSLDTNDDPQCKWASPLYEVLPYIDVFLPSEREICLMAGGAPLDDALEQFAPRVPTIVVKRGRRGCRVRHLDQVFNVAGVTVSPVDTIGAGDSFDAGFLSCWLRGLDLAVCARAGNITGALSTLGAGGTEAFRNPELRQAFLREHGYPFS